MYMYIELYTPTTYIYIYIYIIYMHVQWNLYYYCGHHWDPTSNCPDCRGVLNSGVVLYTELQQLGHKQVSILKRCPYFRGVHISERFHCTCIRMYVYIHVHVHDMSVHVI